MISKRLLFVIIYIIIDIIYVFSSKRVYDDVATKIQGSPMTNRGLSAVFAWICMGLGWYYLTSQIALKWSLTMHPVLAGFLAGLIHGLLCIGTFNFTLNAMLNKWSGNIMIRDLSWGIGWSILVTILFTITKK